MTKHIRMIATRMHCVFTDGSTRGSLYLRQDYPFCNRNIDPRVVNVRWDSHCDRMVADQMTGPSAELKTVTVRVHALYDDGRGFASEFTLKIPNDRAFRESANYAGEVMRGYQRGNEQALARLAEALRDAPASDENARVLREVTPTFRPATFQRLDILTPAREATPFDLPAWHNERLSRMGKAVR